MGSTFSFSEESENPSDAGIDWTIESTTPVDDSPGTPVFESADLHVSKTGIGYRLAHSGSVLMLDLAPGTARLWIDPSIWIGELRPVREFFQLGMLMMLHKQGKWGLHAVGLTLGESSVLLVGDSGAGKTTTALSLIRQGWNYLSDDAICLATEGSRVVAYSFRRGFAPTDEGWTVLNSDQPVRNVGDQIAPGKWLVDMESLKKEQHADSCTPTIVAFPVISKIGQTGATRVSRTEGLARMLPQCAGITSDREQAAAQMKVLGELAGQVRFYELHVGRDVFDNPEHVSTLLREIAGPDHE